MTGLEIVHVERPPLPWRDEELTECGLTASNHPTITREELLAKVRREGKQRSQITTCQTCWNTAQRHPTWADDPAGRLERELGSSWGGDTRRPRANRELRAIELLIAAHRAEFDALLAGLDDVADLAARRKARR